MQQNQRPTCVVLNLYYPRPGAYERVLSTRQRASQIRQELGLPPGRILSCADTQLLAPVIWECGFDSITEHDSDMQHRAGSAEFESIRSTMRTLVDRFERTLWRVEDGADIVEMHLHRDLGVQRLLRLWRQCTTSASASDPREQCASSTRL